MSIKFTVARRMRHHERMMQRQGEREMREHPPTEKVSLKPLAWLLLVTSPFFYLAMALMAALAGFTGAAIWIAPFVMVPAIIFITHWAFGIQRRRDVRHAE